MAGPKLYYFHNSSLLKNLTAEFHLWSERYDNIMYYLAFDSKSVQKVGLHKLKMPKILR